ncbi:solute carrier organic anion transporter family member 4A1-like [Patiria miniata]|uniref:Solute carrier organic anion transporter family member n=1 Tax=Patiria miniata TaxID=46514 RepID=A0A914AKJ1_PATMI|nr:solute carrier organic anion transporter family member 4A1-like [Patiria miniata]
MAVGEPKQQLACIEEDAPECRYFSFSPPCLQRFARPAFFVFIGCMFFFMDGFVVGMFQGVLTTIEHRYQLNVTQLSMIVGAYCIGGVIGITCLILFLSRPDTNRARVMGICCLLNGLAICSQTIPQFIQSPYVPGGFETSNNSANAYQEVEMVCRGEQVDEKLCTEDQVAENVSPNQVAFYVLFFGSMLEGVFFTIVFTLVETYIADSTTPGKTAFYMGILGAVGGLSPVAGIFVTAAFLGLWVDFYRVPSSAVPVSPNDHEWVGAWWLGFAMSALLSLLPVVPFFGFPSVMRNSQGTEAVNGDGYQQIQKVVQASKRDTFKDSLVTFWRVLKNRDCMLTCLSQACAILILYGYGTFVPKYLEVQFEMATQLADILTGCLLAPAYAIGYVLAGSLVKRFNIQYQGLVSLSCVALALGVIGFTVILFSGCQNENLAGVFTPYVGQSHLDLKASCNSDCACSLSVYSPVCDGQGITYFSACHAGCRVVTEQEYGDCSCLTTGPTNTAMDLNANGTSVTVEEACDNHCTLGALYLVVLTVVLMLAQFAQLMRLNVVIRCVSPEDRPVALGVYNATALLASAPASYVFGAIIDSACMVWQQTCYGQGACLLYDKVWYRFSYNGLALGVGILCLGSMLIVWKFPSYTDKKVNNNVKEEEYASEEKSLTGPI